MKATILDALLITALVTRVSCHPADSTFQQLVCQQCNSWCSAQQRDLGGPRTGKTGPRGIAGPRGPPGIVNRTAIEKIIDRKIGRVASSLTRQSCVGVDMESAKATNATGGVFEFLVPTRVGLSEVYCDVITDGGNWIVFQRRMDGSVDFNRNWNDYVNGFGSLRGEFWLGLDAIYHLTKRQDQELRIDMITKDGNYFMAKYSLFRISSGADNFRLSVSGYSGNATDSLLNSGESWASHHNQPFSTSDKDLDTYNGNCATDYKGGWWYNACHRSNLNGIYNEENHPLGTAWFHHGRKAFLYMRFTEMKFRPRI